MSNLDKRTLAIILGTNEIDKRWATVFYNAYKNTFTFQGIKLSLALHDLRDAILCEFKGENK